MAALASAKELMNRSQTMASAEWAVPNEAGYLCGTMQTSGNSWWGHCGINPSFLIFALMLCNHSSDDKGVDQSIYSLLRLLLWHWSEISGISSGASSTTTRE